MSHFTGAFFDFLRDLKRHNDRDWFADNKARYARDVQDPFLQFIGDFAPRLRQISRAYVADTRKDGRLHVPHHRDTRFSPDKSPVQDLDRRTVSARGAPEGGGRRPGILPPPGSRRFVRGGGVYHIELPQLTKIRRRIVDEPKAWTAAVKDLELQGEQLKRAPSGFPATHEAHRGPEAPSALYARAIHREGRDRRQLPRTFRCQLRARCPLIEFQTKALGLRW
jgi:uncharacterized protein (TIGR02453 family)